MKGAYIRRASYRSASGVFTIAAHVVLLLLNDVQHLSRPVSVLCCDHLLYVQHIERGHKRRHHVWRVDDVCISKFICYIDIPECGELEQSW